MGAGPMLDYVGGFLSTRDGQARDLVSCLQRQKIGQLPHLMEEDAESHTGGDLRATRSSVWPGGDPYILSAPSVPWDLVL